MAGGKILAVDDDTNLLQVLKYNLLKEGYEVVTAEDGTAALETARREQPDLIILDIMLPGLNGLEICRILRKEMSVPILMLTAKTEEVDKIVGLELGADDYITKPFSIRELMARVHATLRRSEWQRPAGAAEETEPPQQLRYGNLEVDLSRHEVYRGGAPVKLSPREFRLLAFLMQHRGQVFNREKLVERVWGYDYEGGARTVDVHIRSLRQRIEDNPSRPRHVLTVHGFGYKFEE